MYKVVLNQISDIATWPIIALLIFVTVFILMAIHAIRLDKQEANRFAAIPLDNDQNKETSPNGGHTNGSK